MKAQTKAIVASVVVIALALSAVSGITYSWWSDTEQTNVTVNTGNLDVKTSEYKLTLVTSSGTKTLASGDSAPETIAISYGGTTGTGAYELQGYGVDPTNLELTISYKATFTASVNYQYTIAASFPENIGTVSTATIGETTTSLPVQKNGEATTGAPITHVYNVSIKITSLPAGVADATAILKNFITQKAANVVEDLSKVTAGTTATIVSQATTTGSSTTTTPVTVDFSSVPNNAANLTTEIETDGTSTDAPTAKINLRLTDSSGQAVDLGEKQTSVSFTMDGYYTNVMYYDSSSSDYSQPSASFVYYKDGDVVASPSGASDVDKTKITFVTDHFSKFVAYAGEFPVNGADDLKAALNAGVPKIKLLSSFTMDGNNKNVVVKDNVVLNLDGQTLTFEGIEDKSPYKGNIEVDSGANLTVFGKEDSRIVFSETFGFNVAGALVINGDVTFDITVGSSDGDQNIIATSLGSESASVTINGGTFVGCEKGAAVYSKGGTITIYDGMFSGTKTGNGNGNLLNQKNGDGEHGTITVYGGTFTGYNPADGDDVLSGSFVADGYAVKELGNDKYQVVPAVAVVTDSGGNVVGYYADLVAAKSACPEEGKVKLLDDVDLSNGIVI